MDAPLIGRADGLRCDERSGLLEARRTSLYWGMDPDDAAYRGEWTAPVPGVPGTRMDGELAHRCYLWLTKTEPARRRTRREAGKLLRDLGLPGRGHEGKPGGGMT